MKDINIKAKYKGNEIEFKLSDLYGYEGEVSGIIIGVDKSYGETVLSYNSGYGFSGLNKDIEIISCNIIEDDIKSMAAHNRTDQ